MQDIEREARIFFNNVPLFVKKNKKRKNFLKFTFPCLFFLTKHVRTNNCSIYIYIYIYIPKISSVVYGLIKWQLPWLENTDLDKPARTADKICEGTPIQNVNSVQKPRNPQQKANILVTVCRRQSHREGKPFPYSIPPDTTDAILVKAETEVVVDIKWGPHFVILDYYL